MPNSYFGDLDFLGTVINSNTILLGGTWGLASFPTPTLVNGIAGSDAALNVYEIDATTGFLTFVSAISDPIPLASNNAMAQLYLDRQSFVVTGNSFNENLAIWELSDAGTLTRTLLLNAPSLPLSGLTDITSFNLNSGAPNVRDGFLTANFGEGLTLWEIGGTGTPTQLDNVAVNSINSVNVGTYRHGTFLLAGSNSNRTVKVVEVAGNQLTEVSTFNLQSAGFFGNVTTVKSFAVDGICIVVVVTGVGEILLLGLRDDGTLHLVESHVWQDEGHPIRNADDVELVFTDGQALLVIAGNQPQTESNLAGISLFYLGTANDNRTGDGGRDDMQGFGNQDSLSALGGADRIYGGSGDDFLQGGAGTDLISGGLGDDLIYGGSGNDTISGNTGGDSIEGADSMEGGFGIDTLNYDAAKGRVVVNLATQTVSGKGAVGDVIVGFENVWGSKFDDVLTGDTGGYSLYGGAGNDMLSGGDGNGTLLGVGGDDTLNGNAGEDRPSGASGLNQLSGGDGNARVQIGGGNDYARGGAGADTFAWVLTGAETSRIYDFTQGEDLIDIAVNMTEAEVFCRHGDDRRGSRLYVHQRRPWPDHPQHHRRRTDRGGFHLQPVTANPPPDSVSPTVWPTGPRRPSGPVRSQHGQKARPAIPDTPHDRHCLGRRHSPTYRKTPARPPNHRAGRHRPRCAWLSPLHPPLPRAVCRGTGHAPNCRPCHRCR